MKWLGIALFVAGFALASARPPMSKLNTASRKGGVRPGKPTSPPPFDQTQAKLGDPVVTAQRAVVIDAVSGRVLWERNSDSPSYPASTTKICTALVFSELTRPTDLVTAPQGIEQIGEASLHLTSGETMTAEDLLAAILLRSANDACVTAAFHIGGSVQAFADLMNKKATEVGCTNSHFVNPNGLHDPHHTTTAHDLAMLGRAALQIPRIANIVHDRDKTISRSVNVGDVKLKSKNSLIGLDPSCIGIKTGWTIPAGHCFVGAFVRDGMTFVTATLGSADWRNDHVALATYAAENYHPVTWVKAGDVLGEAKVEKGKVGTISAVASAGGTVLVRRDEPAPEVIVEPMTVKAPVKAGTVIGHATLKNAPGIGVDLVAKDNVEATVTPSGGANPLPWIVGAGMVGLVTARLMSRRGKRRGR